MILPRYSVYAAFLAAAGIPIYIHAPKFFADQYGVSLGAIGLALVGLRLLDVVQDPLLGRFAGRLQAGRRLAALVGSAGLCLGMFGLFVVTPPVPALWWMVLCLTVLFTAFSFLTILFYSRGVAQARVLGARGHVRLAGWREFGALTGVSIAAVAPYLVSRFTAWEPYVGFTILFIALAVTASIAMHSAWPGPASNADTEWRGLLADPQIRRLLVVALFNAAPVAVTSTLFLFFVEYRLALPDLAGVFLLLFFVAAALSAPVWSMLSARFGARSVLSAGMVLSVLSFIGAYGLTQGHAVAFGVVCLASGAALGADMTLLPAIFAKRISDIGENSGLAFGLWGFCSKFTLALAAATVLPLLEASGFRLGGVNDEAVLTRLSVLYALVPCGLKLVALAILVRRSPQRVIA
ncbi:MAG: MFS transporter [Paracoccaceae bacterium]